MKIFQAMKRLIAITIILLSIASCTFINVSRTLNDVESYIMERPDSALAVLESIDRVDLNTARTKAHHALLHAMALDKNFIDVTEDSIAKVATEYYKKHGPRRNYARALYYLGKSYYYNEEYDKAILEYSKAEKVAVGCDSLYLGMIYSAEADTYNKTYNSIEELNCIQRALKVFKSRGLLSFARSTEYSLGVAFHNTENYKEAIALFTELVESSQEIDYYHIQSNIAIAHSMIEFPDCNFNVVDSLFRKAHYEYNAEFTDQNYWAWVYSLYRIGNYAEAERIIRSITNSDDLTTSFWKMRIAEYLEDYKAAYKLSKYTDIHQNHVIDRILRESLAAYQRDYYQSQLELTENKIKTRSMELIAAVASAILLLLIIYFIISRYLKRQMVEKEKLLEYAEEIKRQLNDAKKNDYPALKRKYISLYKSRFETIGSLSEQYIQAEGRTDIESVMYKKVLKLINEVKKDYLNRARFEAMLDEDLDMIMTHLRKEMPKFSETDYSIFSYLIVGFDATTISRLLDISVNNIYAHKRRIRIRIEKYQPEHATQFLEMLT